MRQRTRGLGTGGQVALGLALALGVVTILEATGRRGDCRLGFGASWVSRDDDGYGVRIREGGCRFEARIRPPFAIDDAETTVTAVGPGGQVEIDDRGESVRRRFEATPGVEGPRLRYFRDEVETPLDEDGREWLAVALPRALRASGADVEARIGRLLRRGGLDAVIAEAEEIGADAESRRFLEAVREHGLDPAGEAAVLALAARTIGSDVELAELLAGLADDGDGGELLADPAVRNAFVDAAGTIGSDFELRRALGAHLRGEAVGAATAEAVVAAAAGIGSDFELADLLGELADAADPRAPLPVEVAERLVEIGADHELGRAVLALLERPDLTREAVDDWLEAARTIGSDADLAEVLIAAAAAWPATSPLPAPFFTAAAGVGSDYQSSRVLAAVAARPGLVEEDVAKADVSATALAAWPRPTPAATRRPG